MKRKKYSPEQIVRLLRNIEKLAGEGMTNAQACQQEGISEQTFYRWKSDYGRTDVNVVKKLKEMEAENARLKKLVAEQALDMDILKESNKFLGNM